MVGATIFLMLVCLLVGKMVYDHQKYKEKRVISEDDESDI